jgi:DNA invertase Pin-like site-specific DNA recombinase
MSTVAPTSRASLPATSSDRITTDHLTRLAVVYVRQSTQRQVLEHQESTRLQYSLREKAASLGWSAGRISVIDDDLGVSGATAEGREGFQKLVGAITLGHVGLVLGIEMSRLARSCKDWYHLLEICAYHDTLIADLDGIYDPSQYNDRLVLGLKGTISEAELHVIRQRLTQGKLQKASRGELALPLPLGYVRRPSGEVTLDPDERAQAVVRRVFDEFDRCSTTHGVLAELVRCGVKLPFRQKGGPGKGDLDWRPPCRATISEILRNPAYAGIYAYGRSAMDRRRHRPHVPGSGRVRQSREEWLVEVTDRLPAYITREQYEGNQLQLQANRSRPTTTGSIRSGSALLQGLVFCGRCARRMMVGYSGGGATKFARYRCDREYCHRLGPLCQSLVADPLDDAVVECVMQALEPASLEVSMKVCADIERQRAELEATWQRRLERATYEADRAARQYNSVEPENRLVARTLEAEWETKLVALRQLREEYERSLLGQPRVLTDDERCAIRLLADDLPCIWQAESTSDEDRKRILRIVIERVDVTVDGETERVDVVIHWAGGSTTELAVQRPISRFEDLSYFPQLLQRIRELHEQGATASKIARSLTLEGWRPPRRRTRRITAGMVRVLMVRHGLTPKSNRKAARSYRLKENEWWVPDLARELNVPIRNIYHWLQQGRLNGRKIGGERGRWVVVASEKELQQLGHAGSGGATE